MKTILRIILIGAALGVCTAASWAEPPPPRSQGTVLVLDNGRTLEGDIEFHGTQFRIRRSAGEVWVPAEPGMRLCADWKEAFAFMAAQANQLDPDERVRLARWCQLHGMREQALAEASAAVQMQPNHREARQMRDALERDLAMEKAESAATSPAASGKSSKLPVLDISSDAVAMFSTRVQPILMNTCVSCHSGNQAGRFQLYRTYNGGQRAATLKNLAAILPLINPESPELSPVLIKAVSPHSSRAPAPLRNESVPFYTLQTWVLQLLATNPQLRAGRPKATGSSPVRDARSAWEEAQARFDPKWTSGSGWKTIPDTQRARATAVKAEQTMSTGHAADSVAPPAVATPTPSVPDSAPASEQPASFSDQRPSAPPEPTDPFDPILFNGKVVPPG